MIGFNLLGLLFYYTRLMLIRTLKTPAQHLGVTYKNIKVYHFSDHIWEVRRPHVLNCDLKLAIVVESGGLLCFQMAHTARTDYHSRHRLEFKGDTETQQLDPTLRGEDKGKEFLENTLHRIKT